MKNIRLQAHRGVASEFPENTMAAFKASIDQGYGIIELDAKYTKDNVCVLLHDSKLYRTARTKDGERLDEETRIGDVTFAEARELDFGLWMGEEFRGEKILSLDELLEFIAQYDMPYKFDNVWESFTDEHKKDFLSKLAGAKLGKRIGITCRSLEGLQMAVNVLDEEAEIHWDKDLDEETLKEVAKIATGRRLTIWACYPGDNSPWFKGERASVEVAERIHKYGELGIWIITREDQLERAVLEFGADAIETTGTLKPYMLEKFN